MGCRVFGDWGRSSIDDKSPYSLRPKKAKEKRMLVISSGNNIDFRFARQPGGSSATGSDRLPRSRTYREPTREVLQKSTFRTIQFPPESLHIANHAHAVKETSPTTTNIDRKCHGSPGTKGPRAHPVPQGTSCLPTCRCLYSVLAVNRLRRLPHRHPERRQKTGPADASPSTIPIYRALSAASFRRLPQTLNRS